MAEKNYSLLIAALVAVVAIVGLVLYAQGGTSMVVFRSTLDTPLVLGPQGSISALESFYELGKSRAGPMCTGMDTTEASFSEVRRCCNDVCTNLCAGVGEYKISGRTVDDCFRNCESGCQAYNEAVVSVSPRYENSLY